MSSISELTQEYERIARLVLAGRHAEAEQPALELRHLLTKESGFAHTKRCLQNLLADIARGKSTNGNGNSHRRPAT